MYILDKLDNGIRIVMEKIDYFNSATIGIIIDSGSVKENDINNGVSHFIEHMLFKGTKSRTPKEIAEAIDNVGGQLNAFTGKEQTVYYAKVLDNHLPIAIDVLTDMFLNSLFLEEEIEKEKNVIMEEINMYQDSPEDLSFELLNEIMFKGTPLEYPILGTEKSIMNLNKDIILEYFYKNYIPEDIVISLVGKFDEKEVISQLNNTIGKFNINSKRSTILNNKVYKFTNNIKGINKNFEQLNLCIGMNGVDSLSDDVHPIFILNNIFGGSMSSILFQKLREDKGLVYAIDSHMATYNDTGIFTIYAGLNSENLIKSIKLIDEEIRSIKKKLITKDELKKSKEQLKGNYILGMESTFNRMIEIGKSISQLDRIETPEEVIEKIDKVNMYDIERVVNHIFQVDSFNIAYVGELDKQEKTEEEIKQILFR